MKSDLTGIKRSTNWYSVSFGTPSGVRTLDTLKILLNSQFLLMHQHFGGVVLEIVITISFSLRFIFL